MNPEIQNKTFLVGAILPDRVGILRDVTGALFRAGANLTDLRQTVVGGVFTLSAIAEFPPDNQYASGLADLGLNAEEAIALAVRSALPDATARVFAQPCAPHDASSAAAGERYVASIVGPDRPGRIHEIARIFADAGVNVEDWRHDFSDPERTLTVGIVTVPPSCDVPALQKSLADTLGPTGLATSLRHENIFRATNEVGPIRNLLDPSAKGVSRNA